MSPEEERIATRAAEVLDRYAAGGFQLRIFQNDWGNWVVSLQATREGKVVGQTRTAETQQQAMIHLAFALDRRRMLA